MALINLICPHCSGKFEMDTERPLQSFWVCPYCGNRSLMQKSDDTIRLRGIIPGRPSTQSTSSEDAELLTDEAATQVPKAIPESRPIRFANNPVSPMAAFLAGKPYVDPKVEVSSPEAPVAPKTTSPAADEAVAPMPASPAIYEAVAPMPASPAIDEAVAPKATSPAIDEAVAPKVPAVDAPLAAAMPERFRSLAEIIADASTEPATPVPPAPPKLAAAPVVPPAPRAATAPVAAAPSSASLSWIPDPVIPTPITTPQPAPFRLANHAIPKPAINSPANAQAPVTALPDNLDHLCKLAQDAAANRDFPLFNAYSRQAIDCQPKDPRMYTLRAELIEEADGFARATWTEPGWHLLTPRRKASIIAQHLYNFNTAMKFSRVNQQPDLISSLSWQLVRQAIDFFTEQGELRSKGKQFKGRFNRHDLKLLPSFIDALSLINKLTCPIGSTEIQAAVRAEISKAPPSIARHFKRI